MKAPAPADLQRWSEDVARDPASLDFLPLARAFRKQGRRDSALKLCLRGLEHHPTHVDAHALLAVLYFESGQRSKAYDEWSMVLRLEPENFEALRGMGFYHLEQGDDISALRTLQRAGALEPSDLAVQEGLRVIYDRRQPAPTAPVQDQGDPWDAPDQQLFEQRTQRDQTEYEQRQNVAAPQASTPEPAPQPGEAAPAVPRSHDPTIPRSHDPTIARSHDPGVAEIPADPTRLFDPLLRSGQILGALILDHQGLVLAGSLTGETGSKAETLGAILGGAIEEAARTAHHLALGEWKGILLESELALLHLSPIRDGMVVLLAAKRETPAGWMLRSAHQAAALATRFLEIYA